MITEAMLNPWLLALDNEPWDTWFQGTRLILADWLDDHGLPVHGNALRQLPMWALGWYAVQEGETLLSIEISHTVIYANIDLLLFDWKCDRIQTIASFPIIGLGRGSLGEPLGSTTRIDRSNWLPIRAVGGSLVLACSEEVQLAVTVDEDMVVHSDHIYYPRHENLPLSSKAMQKQTHLRANHILQHAVLIGES